MQRVTLGVLLLLAAAAHAADAPGVLDTARKGDTARMAELLRAEPGAVAVRDARQRTPLHAAVEARQLAMVELLLAAGADPGATDAAQATPLHLAAAAIDPDLVDRLLAVKVDVNAADERGQTPLHAAAHGGTPSGANAKARDIVATALLAHGADPNRADAEGLTALHAAAIHGRNEMIASLLSAKADVSATDQMGRLPLHWAALNGHERAVTFLLGESEDYAVADKNGDTPLHCAARRAQVAVARLLLRPEALKPNAEGQTPLHLLAAAPGSDREMDGVLISFAKILIEAGLDATAGDHAGRSALDLAREHDHEAFAKFLEGVAAGQ